MRQPIGKRSENWQCGARTTTSPLHVSKTKELIVDYRKSRAKQALINIVESFKFLGVHITYELSWSKLTKTVLKSSQQNFFPIWRLKGFGIGPEILKMF